MKVDLYLKGTIVSSDIKIFVLEDTPAYQKEIQSALRGLGFSGEIFIAPTLAEGLEILNSITPGLILCDWNLPDGTGFNFLRAIRKTERLKDIPVLMVTTMDDIKNILDAVKEGADGYIVKPFEREDFEERIAFALEKRTIPQP